MVSSVPQIVPSKVCLSCEVCCRFPEQDSFLRPYFTKSEVKQAIERGIDSRFFPSTEGCQIEVVRNPSGDGYLCPAFDPETFHCRIYEIRPLDCQIYPFVLMWDKVHRTILLGWDTKCPFLFPTDNENHLPLEVSTLTVLPILPADVMAAANQLALQLEESTVKANIVEHPHLVTPFQSDVVVIRSLPQLTQSVGVDRP